MFSQMTVEQIDNWLKNSSWEERLKVLNRLQQDNRKGVQALSSKWEKRCKKREEAYAFWEILSGKERALASQGWQYIAGVDEAGRGPLAGPVVAAAVILPRDVAYIGLNDSKRLSREQREDLYKKITSTALAWAVGSAGAEYIDTYGIVQATKHAMVTALQQLQLRPDYLLLDAISLAGMQMPQESIIGGDGKCACIAAASVVAKVTRDLWMSHWDQIYPGYGFAHHKGYLTKEHYQAIATLGPSPLHRLSFAPLAEGFPVAEDKIDQ
ncbi:MAG: ribonuclease HII [bacterium]|jgi:ribonuclease HII